MAERRRVIGVMFVNLEGVTIVAIQSILCADPDEAAAVLEDSQAGAL